MLITQVSFHWDILLYLSYCTGYVEHPRYCKLCKLRVRLVWHHTRVEPELGSHLFAPTSLIWMDLKFAGLKPKKAAKSMMDLGLSPISLIWMGTMNC